METLAERLQMWSSNSDNAIAGSEGLSWIELRRRAVEVESALHPEDLLIIKGAPSTWLYVTIVGSILADTPFLILSPADRLDSDVIVSRLGATVIAEVNETGISINRVSPLEWALGRQFPPLRYVGVTSGSTRSPRFVLVPKSGHDAFLSTAVEPLELDTHCIFGDPAPLSDLSLTNFLLSMYAGCTWAGFWRLRDRLRLPQMLRAAGVTHWRAAPFWAVKFLRYKELPNCTLRFFGFGGDILTYDTVRRMRLQFPCATIFNTYGATETCGFASFGAIVDDASHDAADLCSIGAPLNGWELAAVPDETGNLELVVSGAHLATGSLEIDNGRPWTLGIPYTPLNGRFRSRDGVVLASDTSMIITGRLDRRFNHRGFLVSPEPLEKQLFAELGKACYVVQDAGEIVVVIADEKDPSPDHLMEERVLSSVLPPYLSPLRIARVEYLPYLPSGKLDVHSLRVARGPNA